MLIFIINAFPQEKTNDNNTYNLKKIGEISKPSSENKDFFIKITGLCTDDNSNLYAVDSGWNAVFKFDSKDNYIRSFGRDGQGPGEFLGNSLNCSLGLSFGRDGKLYVLDNCNKRISIFSPDGKFIRQLSTSVVPNDTAIVNSNGDIYLLSKSGIKVVDCFNSNFKFKDYLLEFSSHLQFPLQKPFSTERNSSFVLRQPAAFDIIELVTKDDRLILISNFSLKVFVFGIHNQKLNEFDIEEKLFINDYRIKLKRAEKEFEKLIKNSKRKEKLSMYVSAFKAFLDKDDNLCLVCSMNDGTPRIFRYKTNGLFLDTWTFPEKIDGWYICSNNKGKIYATKDTLTKIGIYEF
jgi:hypothetical protein